MNTANPFTSVKPMLKMNITLPHRSPRFKNTEDEFLELSYQELEERNLAIRQRVESNQDIADQIIKELETNSKIKAVTLYFSDLEGKLHGLDFDRKHLLSAFENLTFDGSSINGFSELNQSDLRLTIDWKSFRWVPADIFGKGKVIVFANICEQDGSPYEGDYRSNLMLERNKLMSEKGIKMNLAPEIEGFLLEGQDVEKNYDEKKGFKPASVGGYFNTLPQDKLRVFIDWLAEATRALGFWNEKDHPEVAPGQFELNYRFRDVLHAADQIQLYKLVARQIANQMGLTASFLPKPIARINGSGMHSNISLEKDGKNLFFDAKGLYKLSEMAQMFTAGVLSRGQEICLVMNPSVNAYRRLDPNFEAPNAVKMSASDRGAMVRIPIGNEKSTRMEVRTVAPDANPYLTFTLILKAGIEGIEAKDNEKTVLKALIKPDSKAEILPGTIQEAIELFKGSDFIQNAMGKSNQDKYLALKSEVADRSPKSLGYQVKKWEVIDHHEVRNQDLSKEF